MILFCCQSLRNPNEGIPLRSMRPILDGWRCRLHLSFHALFPLCQAWTIAPSGLVSRSTGIWNALPLAIHQSICPVLVPEETPTQTRPPTLCNDIFQLVVGCIKVDGFHQVAIFSKGIGSIWNNSFKLQTKTTLLNFIVTNFFFIFIIVVRKSFLFVLVGDHWRTIVMFEFGPWLGRNQSHWLEITGD